MTSRLRFTLTCALLALPLAGCGDDGNTTTDDSATGGPTGSGTTDDSPTSTTDDSPTSTTDDSPTSTTDDSPTSTTDDDTSTTDDGTTGDDPPPDTTGGVALSWAKDVYPVVVMGNCGCHGGGSGGLKMTNADDSFAAIVGVDATQVGFKRVVAGEPENSYFLAKVAGTAADAPFNSGSPSQMPLNGAPLSQAAIDTLTQWIAEGANP